MKPLKLYITEKRDLPLNKSDLDSSLDLDHKIFIIVKPGFLEYASDIIDMYKKEGFVLYEQRPKQLQLSEARKLYSMHKNEDWYKALCEYMASGVSMGITFIYRGSVKEAFKKCSELKDKIRDEWAEDDKRNVMHSSDNPENMKKESSFYV